MRCSGIRALAGLPGPLRERYLRIIHESAKPYLFPAQQQKLKVVPATLGELSQAIGAALVALCFGLAGAMGPTRALQLGAALAALAALASSARLRFAGRV